MRSGLQCIYRSKGEGYFSHGLVSLNPTFGDPGQVKIFSNGKVQRCISYKFFSFPNYEEGLIATVDTDYHAYFGLLRLVQYHFRARWTSRNNTDCEHFSTLLPYRIM
mgnify:CR=1 FL=1|jgi:hypothetical protein